eukprot:g8321.t1
MAPVTFYTAATPNATKISILLEELGIDYEVRVLDLKAKEQKEEWFLKINPNGRIPALVDHENGEISVFESGAIMIYLVDTFGKGSFLPKEGKSRYEVISWLMFQMSGVGPIFGQLTYFMNYASENIPFAKKRFYDEGKRIFSVIENQLSDGREYLVEGSYSIADIAIFTWAVLAPLGGYDLDEYPYVKAWTKRIYAREAVKKGLNVPVEFEYKTVVETEEVAKATAQQVLEKINA